MSVRVGFFCVCVGFFFSPLNPAAVTAAAAAAAERKASMRSSFVFHFTFRVTFGASGSPLTVANPRLGKIRLGKLGGGRGDPERWGLRSFQGQTPNHPDPPPTPEKPFSLLPTGPRQRSGTQTARSIHPGPDIPVLGWQLLTCISVAFPVCRPLTTGAIFVSQRCSLKPFKNGEGGAGKKKRQTEKDQLPI